MSVLHSFWIILILFTSGCVPPVYEGTASGIEEFIQDSSQIATGKYGVLQLENPCACSEKFQTCHEATIRDDDTLSLSLYYPKRPDLVETIQRINSQTGFRVCDGKIYLPAISSIDIEGLNLNQAREKIQLAYSKQFPQSQIFLNFKKRRERQVQIIGASHPLISVDNPTRLSEVLAKAQLSPYANLFKSYAMREGQQLPVDIYKLLHEGDDSQNILMQGGDQIFIAKGSDAIVMVTGEVPRPMAIPIPYGFISLREAIVVAGGIPFTGDKTCIYVVRGNSTLPKIYHLAWREISHMPNHSLLLMDGDIVFVSEKPITQWNRFIDQLQPSLLTVGSCCNSCVMMRD